MANLGKLIQDKAAADTQWREQRQAERETTASIRDAAIVEITTEPESFARYLDMQGDNPTYSAGNVVSVMAQKPEATLFCTAERWKSLGRFVLDAEAANGAKIFVRSPTGRGYALADAYDVTQTQGREVREQWLFDDTPEMERALSTLLNYAPVQVIADKALPAGALYDSRKMVLSINPTVSDSQAFASIAAEITHARFHDRGRNPDYHRETCELSAQSASYILCRQFGIHRELPDLSALPERCQGWTVQDRTNLLNGIQTMCRQIGGAIERAVSPPQRASPAPRRDAR